MMLVDTYIDELRSLLTVKYQQSSMPCMVHYYVTKGSDYGQHRPRLDHDIFPPLPSLWPGYC